jgi:hypothetical protein
VLFIRQDNKIGLNFHYSVFDAIGQPVARTKRNLLTGLWRKQWTAETVDGRPIFTAR